MWRGISSHQVTAYLPRGFEIGMAERGHRAAGAGRLTTDGLQLNILISNNFHAVITDFGSARILKSGKLTSQTTGCQPSGSTTNQAIEGPKIEFSTSTKSITLSGPAWTIRWAAPELLNGDSPSLASDIWALGWICWEARIQTYWIYLHSYILTDVSHTPHRI